MHLVIETLIIRDGEEKWIRKEFSNVPFGRPKKYEDTQGRHRVTICATPETTAERIAYEADKPVVEAADAP